VLKGIDAAQAAGLKVKINAVALKGVNEDELFHLQGWCAARAMDLTFIEVMPMGDLGNEDRLDQYWSLEGPPRPPRLPLHPRRPRRALGRPRPLRPPRRDGPEDRLHHAAHPQFLRKLQPRAAHLHGRALHVPRAGGHGRPPRAAPRLPNDALLEDAIRAAITRKPRGHDFDYSRQTVAGQVTRHMSHTGG
jgi:GTP 3',8-cyclase